MTSTPVYNLVDEPFATITMDINDFHKFFESKGRNKIWSEEVGACGLKMKICLEMLPERRLNFNHLGCTLICDVPTNTRYNIAWRATSMMLFGDARESVEVSFVRPSSRRTECRFNYGLGIVSEASNVMHTISMFSHLGNFFSHYCCYRATTRYSIKFTFHECAPFKASYVACSTHLTAVDLGS